MFSTGVRRSRFVWRIDLRSISTFLRTIKALLQRVEAKDYRDIAALLEHGVTLEAILGSARALFGLAFNPLIAQKTLCYFKGGDLESLDANVRNVLLAAAGRDVTPSMLNLRSPRLE